MKVDPSALQGAKIIRYQRGMPQDANGWNFFPKRDMAR
jgi:hypothetical protein